MRYIFMLGVLGLLALPVPDSAQAHAAQPPGYYVPPQLVPVEPSTLVRQWYRRYLNREADPGGVATWVDSLRAGNPREVVLASILASDEYYRKAGSTRQGLVRTLFRDLTGRLPTPEDYAHWSSRLSYEERVDVIRDLLLLYPQAV